MSGGRYPRIGIPWSGGGGGSIAYLSYSAIEDDAIFVNGTVSQAVTVPTNTDYAVIFVGGWRNPATTVSSMSLGGTAASNLYTRAITDTNQDSYVYGVATSAGSKTFTVTLSDTISEGGGIVIVYLSGVNSGNPLVASDYAETTDTQKSSHTWTNMTAVTNGIGLVFASGYYNEVAFDLTAQSQTSIVTGTYNLDNYAAAYKLTTGSTTTLGISAGGNGKFWSAIAITLRP